MLDSQCMTEGRTIQPLKAQRDDLHGQTSPGWPQETDPSVLNTLARYGDTTLSGKQASCTRQREEAGKKEQLQATSKVLGSLINCFNYPACSH